MPLSFFRKPDTKFGEKKMIFPPALRISTCLCEWICGNNLMTGLYFPKARPLYSVMVFNYLFIFFSGGIAFYPLFLVG